MSDPKRSPAAPVEAGYALDNAWGKARLRLQAIEASYDPGTMRHLDACGIGPGWRCMEVGGGGGTIVEWLSRRVGPTGHVLATDLDTRFLEALDLPNLEVRQHNIVTDPIPQNAFDLVHSRMVVSHLPEREQVLRRMVAALKPGGWLVCEETDNISTTLVSPSDAASIALFLKLRDAITRAMAAKGHVYTYGRQLYGRLVALGLVAVGAEGRVLLQHAGAGAELERLTIEQLSDEIIASEWATATEVEACLTLVDSPAFVAMAHTLVAAWGRRPPV
jgi:2-polyprenyl-3-methyl-5-hydroxy-6-metoxy-1,4-benzoquinol methylase